MEDEMKLFLNSIKDSIHIRNGSLVCIKPNLCLMKKSNTGVTTDIRLVSAVIDFIKDEWNCDVKIVEADANINRIDITYKALGFERLAQDKGVTLVNLSREEKVECKTKGFHLERIKMPKILFDCDYLISMAKLKTHSFATISCNLKNQFGSMPGNKWKYHRVVSKVIADVNSVVKPDFCIVDGLIALNGYGPIFGTPEPMNVVLMGDDPVAVDCACAESMGFNPRRIKHIVLSSRAGVGSMNYVIDGKLPVKKFTCKTILDRSTELFLQYVRGRNA